MNLNHDKAEGPNIAGLSLVIYLLACLLSMMAAYEVSKKFDDPRNSFGIGVQSSTVNLHKNSEDRRCDPIVILSLRIEQPLLIAPLKQTSSYQPHHPLKPRVFNARAPPRSPILPA